ncbi:LysR family transcriptional regulator [Paenibacillus glycanilyticus]|uniref:LysR family transcriptional regulator n=1 Tax=Paenibacillus glycanilyticus TaxID=126569 RepID=UPI0020417B2A|nr:LysR family transcriptional regulator [Paenibacillus glycanilyticus]MCM3628363.1 LysR family transcriptional regulator [Paenibacillus glycanilyticus]
MEIRQLEYFQAICDELHFTRAADKLGISQPTLSYQIKQLEDELEVRLFNRIGKRIALTEAGAILLGHSRSIFRSIAGAREEISELHLMERGTLTIGTLIGEINDMVSGLLVNFHKEFPAINIRLLALEDITNSLLQDELDFALTIFPFDDDRFTKISLYKEEFYFVVHADSPLSHKASITYEEMMQEPIIMFPQTYRCRQLVDTMCTMHGDTLGPVIETSSIGSILTLVQAGSGVSILSKTLLEMNPRPHISMIPIKHPALHREVGIVYLKDRFMGKAATAFINQLVARFDKSYS